MFDVLLEEVPFSCRFSCRLCDGAEASIGAVACAQVLVGQGSSTSARSSHETLRPRHMREARAVELHADAVIERRARER